ncbi:MAG: SDR family NAD-dependent epimerase/dehydratase, partial [Candidatus Thermoplasmatota archaeon]|nr:SDR family NAD-dependent epimerase/dehydratase [Candidatus Thermoplasmatota archaeon]
NLGNTEEVSIAELAELCLQITGSDSQIIYEEVGHPGDSRRRNPDISESLSALGWSAQQSLEEGLSSCWRWLQAED